MQIHIFTPPSYCNVSLTNVTIMRLQSVLIGFVGLECCYGCFSL